MTVGERISIRRKELGMTQEELAFRAGYKTKSSINKIELGTNDTTLSKLEIIAEILCTSPSFLMGWEETEKTVASSSKGNADLSSHEQTVITAYRDQPEMRPAVCRILNVSDQPAPQDEPSVEVAPVPTYSPQLVEMSKKYGVSPEFVRKVVEEDCPNVLSVADGMADDATKMRYIHVTDREYELIYAYRFISEKQKEINRILDEPTPEQKKKPKPPKGSGKK